MQFNQINEKEVDQAVAGLKHAAEGLKYLCEDCLVSRKEDCDKCRKGKGAKGKQTEKGKEAQGKQTEKGKGSQGKQNEKGKEAKGKQKVCRHFINGLCHFGEKCRNIHPDDEGCRVVRGGRDVWKVKDEASKGASEDEAGSTPDFNES